MSVVLSRAASPVLSSVKREELRSQTRRLRRKMLFESLEDRSLLATLFWDPNGTAAGVGGSGTWDLSSASWTTDSTGATGHVAWNNANNDTAVFGGTPGTVTIDPTAVPTINVGGIDFAVTDYTVATAATKSLTFAANSNVSVATGSTANISGEMSGAIGFTKTGPGELVLAGTNTYTGPTTVNAGKLSVNGSTASGSSVTVNAGARLGGTGTVSGVVTTVGTGGIDAGLTGATAGTLLIDNAMTLVSTSTFAAQLGGTAAGDGAGFYDQVTASSTVDLGGANLNLTLQGFLPAVNDQFTILDKTSAAPIVGTFNALAEGQQFSVAGTTFQISYVGGNGNDVVLTTITAAIPATPIYINEIYFNPAGGDPPNEYVELRGTPNAVIQNGYYLVGIEGDSTATPGDVQNLFDLSGLVFGSNGLLVIAQKANTYTTAAGANVYVNAGTGAGFGSGTGSSIGHSADSGATDIENSSASFLLVNAPVAPTLTDDIDSDNNGTPDGTVFANWTLLDSVGVTDSASDFGYGALNYDSSGVAVTTGTTVATTFVAGYFGRIGNSVGSTAADWVASVTVGTAPNFSLSNATATTPSSLANLPLNHIGAANPAAPASVGVTVTPTTGLTTTEAGGTATFTIVLNTQPTADVTIPLSSNDTTEGTVSPASVTFTTLNWNVPQTVTVTGADDVIVDGAVAYTIVTGAATSTDPAYSGFDASDVAVSNSDNDAAGVTVTPTTGLTTTEAGGTATFTIVLNTQPTADVTIPLSSNDTTEGAVSPASVTFTTANWNVPQSVTVTGVDDAVVDGTIAYTVVTGSATSTDLAYNGFNAADVSVSNTDNDVVVPGSFTVSPTSGLTTTESGGVAVFTIVLTSQPTADVTVPLTSSDTTEGNVAPTSLTFTSANWNVPQFVTVNGVDDAIADGTIAYSIITGAATSADANYSGVNPADVSLNNIDNEPVTPAGVTVAPTSGLITTESGGTATFTIVLNSQPTGSVTIPLSSNDTTEGTVSPASVTFTTANWNVPQTVTVTGVNDAIVDGTVAYLIVTDLATSTDLAYNGFNANDVGVANTDNDVAGPGSFTVSPTSGLTTTESGGVAVFTVVLNTQPTADVVVPLTSSDTTEGAVSPTSLTFTSANWNVPQFVTVTGADDAITDGTIAYTIITGAATSTDSNYDSVNPADVALNNVDNEPAAATGVTVTPTSGLITTEAGGTATFTIVLNSQPTDSVTIPLSSSDATEGSVSPSSVTFTTANWNVPQTVTVTGLDDAIVDGTVAYTIVTGPATSTDVAYTGFNANDVGVSNTDNDAGPGSFTVSPTSGLTTTESGGVAVFTVVLNTQPTADVIVPLSSSDTTEGNVSPSSLTFTSANWNVPQLVTVTGADDALVDGTIAYTIITGAATSTDTNYSGVNPVDVALNNADNEVAAPSGITVTPTSGLTTTESGGTATFTIVLNSQPTADVTIPLSSSDATEGSVSPSSVTFTTANWNVPQTVTVTGVNDAIVDGNVAYTIITGAATSTDVAYSGLNAADVTASNTDNDVAGPGSFTVSPTSGLTTTESGGVAAFTIVLNTQPTANVTIPLTSSDTTEGTVSPASITFTSANWNVPQLVTVTGVDDALVDGTIAYTIVTGAATSIDTNYNGVNAADVSLSNADNEIAVPSGITVTPSTGLTTTEASGTATFTIVLNSQPTGSVTVPLTSSDLTEGTVSPASITFTTGNWNVPQTVTVTGVDDALVDGNVAYTIITGAATSTDTNYSGTNATDVSVTNTDNETGGNTSPTISDIGNQTANEDTPLNSVPFTVNDAETAANSLTVSATSSDTTLFPAGSITFGGSGANRTISLNPAANQSGTATITVTVDDGAGGQSSDTFTVTVSSVNDAPTLNPISNPPAIPQSSGMQTINLTGISAGGGETQNLTVTATSSNPALIPNPTVTYTSPSSTGTLNYTPVPNQSGTATITVTVTDNGGTANGGVNTTTQTFTVTVTGATIPVPTTPGTAQIVDDPENPGQRVLVINGTSGLDVISLWRSGSNRTLVLVPLSGINQTFDNSAFDRILINAYGGSDRIYFDPSLNKPATIYGDAGDDIILSGAGNDVIYGGSGTDFIYGRGGNDVIFGEAGRDYLYGDDGDDVVVGGNDDDVVWGGNGDDVLNGGAGLDYIYGFGGDDLIIGGNLSQSNSLTGLQSIQSKWTANQPFDTRISSLAAEVNQTTVTNDSKADWIFGMDGREWIVDYALLDLLWDFNSNSDRRN